MNAATAALYAKTTSLESLLNALRTAVDRGEDEDIDFSSLPVFGGTEPTDTWDVWSWDAKRLLTGSCVRDMRIVPRVSAKARRRMKD